MEKSLRVFHIKRLIVVYIVKYTEGVDSHVHQGLDIQISLFLFKVI